MVSASSRPTGTTRAGCSTRSTTVRRPCGSLAVVTVSPGLCRSTYASRCFTSGAPSRLHLVVCSDERVQLPDLAVDGDAPGLDQLVGLAARGDTGPREPCIEAHGVLNPIGLWSVCGTSVTTFGDGTGLAAACPKGRVFL